MGLDDTEILLRRSPATLSTPLKTDPSSRATRYITPRRHRHRLTVCLSSTLFSSVTVTTNPLTVPVLDPKSECTNKSLYSYVDRAASVGTSGSVEAQPAFGCIEEESFWDRALSLSAVRGRVGQPLTDGASPRRDVHGICVWRDDHSEFTFNFLENHRLGVSIRHFIFCHFPLFWDESGGR